MTDFYDYWVKLGKWDSEQAALLFNGKDPSKFGRLVKFPEDIADGHRMNRKEWQREVYRIYSILERADDSDWRRYVDTVSDVYFHFNSPKEASPSAFISLAAYKGIKIPEELTEAYFQQLKKINAVKKGEAMLAALRAYKSSKETNQDKTGLEPGEEGERSGAGNTLPDSKDYEAAFDPLPLGVIAKMFPLRKDIEENHNRWKYYAGKASQNGLYFARMKTGKGKTQSTFNPYLVGCWVTTIKDGLAPDFVNRKLSNNLPNRSEHLKDVTFV